MKKIALLSVLALALGAWAQTPAPTPPAAPATPTVPGTPAAASPAEELTEKIMKAFDEKNYDQAITFLNDLVKLEPEESNNYYNLACAYSQKGDKAKALENLKLSVAKGFDDVMHMEVDTDLTPLHEEQGFKDLVAAQKTTLDKKQMEEVDNLLKEKPSFTFDFDGTTLDGKKMARKDLTGKFGVICVWSVSAPISGQTIEELGKVVAARKDVTLTTIGFPGAKGLTDEQKKEKIDGFLKEKKLAVTCVIGSDEIKGRIPELRGIPTILIVDATGAVRYRADSYRSPAVIEKALQALSEEKPAK